MTVHLGIVMEKKWKEINAEIFTQIQEIIEDGLKDDVMSEILEEYKPYFPFTR